MRRLTLAGFAVGIFLCLTASRAYIPPAPAALKIYPRLTESEYALMQKEAEGLAESLACLGATIERRDPSKNFFELSVGGDPILLVDNSGSQLLVFTPSGDGSSIDLRHWKRRWRSSGLSNGTSSPPEITCSRAYSP